MLAWSETESSVAIIVFAWSETESSVAIIIFAWSATESLVAINFLIDACNVILRKKIHLEKLYTNVFKREDQTKAVSSDHKEKK